jgi:thioredoxin-related protein
MRPFVQRIEAAYQDRVDFHILNVDFLSNRPLMEKYRVAGIPMIVLLDAQGNVFETHLGYMSEADLAAALDRLLDHHAQTN